MSETLEEIQQNLHAQAVAYRDEHTVSDITSFDQVMEFFTPKNKKKPEIHGGFVRGPWCESAESEAMLTEMKLSIRCIPTQQTGGGTCVLTGQPAEREAIIAKAY